MAVVLVSLRLLYQPVTLRSYRELDPQTLVVAGIGAPGAWTHVDAVQETQSTVTISVSAFTLELGPRTDAGNLLEVEVEVESRSISLRRWAVVPSWREHGPGTCARRLSDRSGPVG